MSKVLMGWTIGHRKCRILCLVCSASFLIACYKFLTWPTDGDMPPRNITTRLSSSRVGLTSYQDTTLAGPSPVFDTPSYINVTDDSLLNNSTCLSNESQRNTTLCSGCFRSAAATLQLNDFHSEYVNLKMVKKHFQPVPGVVQNLITDYLITPSLDCPYLLAVQASLKDRPQDRDFVRRTWGSVAGTQTWPNRRINAKMKVLFVVANLNTIEQEKQHNHTLQFVELLSESRLHKDILYINMADGYQNLTLKVLSAFRWVKDNCPCVKFVLKVDFDTFVNVPLLIDTLILHEDRLNFSVLGMVYGGKNSVKRQGHWAVAESLYPLKNYPFYVAGCGYILPMKVISQIVDTAPHLQILPMEDVFITGILRIVLGYQLVSGGSAFTHFHDKWYHRCQFFHDSKILGTSRDIRKHQFVWQSFPKDSCR